MQTFLANLLVNIPVWVPALFVGLLIIGLRASRTRRVPVLVIAALPLMGLLTLRNMIALDPAPWLWIVAASLYLLGAGFGAKLQRGWILAREGRFVELKGEWVTLIAVMALFAAGFVHGTLNSIAPHITDAAVFLVLYSATICLAAGQFLGRAAATLRSI